MIVYRVELLTNRIRFSAFQGIPPRPIARLPRVFTGRSIYAVTDTADLAGILRLAGPMACVTVGLLADARPSPRANSRSTQGSIMVGDPLSTVIGSRFTALTVYVDGPISAPTTRDGVTLISTAPTPLTSMYYFPVKAP